MCQQENSYECDYSDLFCFLCFEDPDGICYECAKRFNVCLNCIAYSVDGNVCENCEEMGDEGVSLTYDLQQVFEYIQKNDEYFQNCCL